MSDYNLAHERMLAVDLGVEEWRLGIALIRCLLGFRKRGEHLGEALLREQARLHGRSFTRARDGLVAKNLLRYEPPESLGRGHRGYYELLLDDKETPAPKRDFAVEPEKPAPTRELSETPAQTPAETPAPERARIEKREENYGKACLEERLEENRSELRREVDVDRLIELALGRKPDPEPRPPQPDEATFLAECDLLVSEGVLRWRDEP